MKNKFVDLIERVGSTFVQTFAGSLVGISVVTDVSASDWKAYLVAAASASLLSATKVIATWNVKSASDVDVLQQMGDKLSK